MTVEQWNKRFSELNPVVPVNTKWTAGQQQKYLRELMQRVPGFYKNPDDYQIPSTPVAPAPLSPSVTPVTVNTSLQYALNSARATVKAIEDLIARGI